jgi:hypothetical protein
MPLSTGDQRIARSPVNSCPQDFALMANPYLGMSVEKRCQQR